MKLLGKKAEHLPAFAAGGAALASHLGGESGESARCTISSRFTVMVIWLAPVVSKHHRHIPFSGSDREPP
jgi:hypothetical protein